MTDDLDEPGAEINSEADNPSAEVIRIHGEIGWRTAREAASTCPELGLSAVPLVRRDKRPRVKAHPALSVVPLNANGLKALFNDGGCQVGMVCGCRGIFAIDLDAGADQARALVEGHLGPPIAVILGRRGCKMLYRGPWLEPSTGLAEAAKQYFSAGMKLSAAERTFAAGDPQLTAAAKVHGDARDHFTKLRDAWIEEHGLIEANRHTVVRKDAAGKDVMKLEILSHGCVAVLPPSKHPADATVRYRWEDNAPPHGALIDASNVITREQITALLGEVAEQPAASEREVTHSGPPERDSDALENLERLARELAAMPPDSGRNIALNDAALILGHMVPHRLSADEVRAALYAACSQNNVLTEDGERQFEASFRSGLKAGMRDPIPRRAAPEEDFTGVDGADDDAAEPAKKIPVSHDGLALCFSARHEHDLRYVHLWGQWLLWDGKRWRPENTLRAFDLARALAREEAAKHKRAQAKEISSNNTVAAIVSLARSDRRHASSSDAWDTDPWLLCTPDGTVDLRTGVMREHRREDLISKTTAVGPDGGCPLWLAFLDQIFRSDQELIAFVQRMLGYTLTGSTREHALFFGYGLGGNGKGVLLNTWHNILGDYAVIAPMGTLTETKSERHPADLAMLRGARAVIAQEVEAGSRWAETRIKALTGGDPVSARFMRQDFFTYVPQFKLLVAGNHKPKLHEVNEAMRRRLHFIPFSVMVAKADRDPKLPEKLKPEWPGILRWAVQGCLDWQRIGFAPPAAVLAATEAYFNEQDAVSRFVADCCMTDDANAVEETGDLYSAWCEWCQTEGNFRTSTKEFSRKLEAHNFLRSADPQSRRSRFHGLRLIRAGMWF